MVMPDDIEVLFCLLAAVVFGFYFTDQTKAGAVVAITSVALLSLVLLMAWGWML